MTHIRITCHFTKTRLGEPVKYYRITGKVGRTWIGRSVLPCRLPRELRGAAIVG